MDQASYFCPQCQQPRLFQSKPMNHTPHILAAVFLCGLWLPIWLLMVASYNPIWRCAFCGYYNEPKYLVNPGLWQQEIQARQLSARMSPPSDVAALKPKYWAFLAIIGGCVLVGAVALGIDEFYRYQRANTPSVTQPVAKSPEAIRQELVSKIEAEYTKKFSDLRCITSGDSNLIFDFTSAQVNEAFVKEFQKPSNEYLVKLRNAGFKSVRFTNKQKSWPLFAL